VATYAWIIDRDLAEEPDSEYSATGVTGPRDASPERITLLNEGVGDKFKMYDDDNYLIYEGRIIGDYTGFEPLDDYGTPNYGCTAIKYQSATDKRKWEVL
jgi:hypothetical protein